MTVAQMSKVTELAPWQTLALSVFCFVGLLVLAGGRASGKTVVLMYAIIKHILDFGADARPIVLREGHAGLLEIQAELYELCVAVWPVGVTRNKQDMTIGLPNGALIQFSNIGDEVAYAKNQGRNYTGLFADEVGNYPAQAFAFMVRLRSNLRVPAGKKPQIVWTCNPHGRSHSYLFKQYISRAPASTLFFDEHGTETMWLTSTFRDNPAINHEDYERQLRASCGNDERLANAWLDGNWSVLAGNMFDNFDPNIHIIDHNRIPSGIDWRYRWGGDFGTASPSTAILLGLHPNGDVVALDECDTCFDPSNLSVGDGTPPDGLAQLIKDMLKRSTGRDTIDGVMDDARGLQSETVIQLLRGAGLNVSKPYKKDRIGGWTLIRQLLEGARTREGPGLYFSTKCPHLIETLPEAPRGVLRPEDVCPRWNFDHHLDGLSYGLKEIFPINGPGCGRTSGF